MDGSIHPNVNVIYILQLKMWFTFWACKLIKKNIFFILGGFFKQILDFETEISKKKILENFWGESEHFVWRKSTTFFFFFPQSGAWYFESFHFMSWQAVTSLLLHVYSVFIICWRCRATARSPSTGAFCLGIRRLASLQRPRWLRCLSSVFWPAGLQTGAVRSVCLAARGRWFRRAEPCNPAWTTAPPDRDLSGLNTPSVVSGKVLSWPSIY